jgi:hypothetical protein
VGEKACSVVNFAYGVVPGVAIGECEKALGTAQGCDSGVHGIPSGTPFDFEPYRSFSYLRYARSVTVKNAVIFVEMDALGPDGKPLTLTARNPRHGYLWDRSGSAVEACDQYETDRATHRSFAEKQEFERQACFRYSDYRLLLGEIMACIEAQGSPVGCSAGTHGIVDIDLRRTNDKNLRSGSIVNGVLSVELTLRDNDGKPLVFEARPEKNAEGAWVWVRSGTVLNACKE